MRNVPITPEGLAQEQLHNLYEKNQDYAIFTVDAEGIIRTWNTGAVRIHQHCAVEAIGRHFGILYPEGALAEGLPATHLRIAKKDRRFRGEGLRVRRNGQLFLADVSIIPMYVDATLVGYSKIVADIEEHGRLRAAHEATLAEINDLHLEKDLRDRFVSALAHDIRNPLMAAKMAMELVGMDDCTIEKARPLADTAARSLERIDRMIVDLLDVTRLKSGQSIPLVRRDFNLQATVQAAVEEMRNGYGDRIRGFAPKAVPTFGDEPALMRAIENLITNAVKYGDEKQAISVLLEDLPTTCAITVHNWGNPIAVQDQKKLFEPFCRTPSAEQSGKLGWGIGLTLVKGIVEGHGGQVTVESCAEKGTTFRIDLPRLEVSQR